jgi:hypothetical protein
MAMNILEKQDLYKVENSPGFSKTRLESGGPAKTPVSSCHRDKKGDFPESEMFWRNRRCGRFRESASVARAFQRALFTRLPFVTLAFTSVTTRRDVEPTSRQAI